jgi:hypothetical protein
MEYSKVHSPFKAYWLRDVAAGLTFRNCTLCPHSIYVFLLVFIWEQTATSAPYNINRLYSNIYPTRCNITQFILSGNYSTYFEWYHHPLSGSQTTVSTASGICRTLLISAAIAADSTNGAKNTRCCRYSCLRSWW